MKEKILSVLQKVVNDFGADGVSVKLDVPVDSSHGDYSTNIALVLAKKLQRNPRELAEEIKEDLISQPFGNTQDKRLASSLLKVEVAGAGFLNFWVSKENLIENLKLITENGDKFGNSQKNSGEKVMLEFGDPNPFKEFHIGHLYTTTIGESLSRLQESQGADVWRVCYQGDVGLHVAKALYGIMNDELGIKDRKDKSIEKKAEFLGKAYSTGSRAYEEEKEANGIINKLNKKIYDRSDPEVNMLYDTGRKWSLEYFDTVYKRLGTVYKKHYFESEVGKIGVELVKKHIGDVFEESDGAVIFPGKKYGLHNRVFINSIGLPTYEAKELGLAPAKYQDFAYGASIIITGNEIKEYFKVLLKALSLVNPDLANKTIHLTHGMVRLPEGKMSSRTGNIITGDLLLNIAREKIQKAYPDMSSETSEKVAVSSVKYALLKSNIGNDISFSFEESISFEGNSGPYLQYTYARTRSVLRKAHVSSIKYQVLSMNFEKEEKNILRDLIHFPEIVEDAAYNFAPSLLCTYLFTLAQKFNLFYQKHKIIGSKQEEFRLTLTLAIGQTLKNGLNLLGIQAPEKM